MRRNGTAYVLASFGVIAAFVTYQVFFNETRKVLRRLREIEIALTAPPNEPDMARFARIARLRHYLAPEIVVVAGPSARQVASRDELLSMLSSWKPPPDGVEVHFVEVQIQIREGKTAADARLTVDVERSGAEPVRETSHAAVGLDKRDGEWIVTTAESRDYPTRP